MMPSSSRSTLQRLRFLANAGPSRRLVAVAGPALAFPLLMAAQAALDTLVGDRELLAQWRYDESRRLIVFSVLRSWADSLPFFYGGAALLWLLGRAPRMRSVSALALAGAIGGIPLAVWAAAGVSISSASFALVGAYLGAAVGIAAHGFSRTSPS